LPSDYIETIARDKYGFVWLGTHNGLIRFDGIQFKTYLHNSADTGSLPDNDARSMIADSSGKVWITSRKGLFYYNYAQDNFVKIMTPANGQLISFASCPQLDPEGRLWFYSNAGICRMNTKSLAIEVFQIKGVAKFLYFSHVLFVTKPGHVYFITRTNIHSFDPPSKSFQKIVIANDDKNFLKEGIQNVFEENKNRLWVASLFGLYLLNVPEKTTQKITYHNESKTDSNIEVNSFSDCPPLTGDSVLWCSTPHHGLVLLNLHTRQFIKTFQKDNYDASSIGGTLCYNSYTDRDGILWISHINGLSKLDWHNQQIKSYRVREMTDSNFMVPPIRKILPDKRFPQNYWLITWGYGVLYYNKTSNRVLNRYQQGADRGSLGFGQDGTFDNEGRLWVGAETGLYYLDTRNNSFISVKPGLPLQMGDTLILRILKDNNNNLWLGTDAGLWKFSISRKLFTKCHAAPADDSSLVNSAVYAMRFDNNGRLYVGTQNGLYSLDTASGKTTGLVRTVESNATDYNINYIWGIDVDRNNNVWVATRGGSLYKYEGVTGKYTDYKQGNGLTTEELRDVYIDSLQNIWVSSYDGIFKLDQATGYFNRYTPEDGLDNFNISLGRWSIIDHKIYSGSPGAYSIIDPYTSKSLTTSFPVWITGIKILNHALHFTPDSIGGITVPVNYPENIISFEFTAVSYTASAKIKYAYMLEGLDKDWQFCENRRFANYNNLAGGSYTFKVKAMNADGFWSDSTASVNIVVKPPFRETGWFRLLVAVAVAGLVTLLVQKRIANIRKQAAYKQQQAVFGQKLAETEMMALRAQMNPHFIFNCMNIIDSLITDNRKEDAQDFLQKFSKLIRLVLENSQHQQVSLQQDLQALKLYIRLEAIRSNHHFKYEFDVDEELIEKDYKIPPLLLQPYIENAILHGLRNKEKGEGRLVIRIKKSKGKIVVTVEDNGIGRKKSMQLNEENKKPYEHLGMKVTGKRISLLRMMNDNEVEVYVDDACEEDETGTRVTVILPEHLKFE
jgi:ligand-binding sensor domain-containing protein